MTPKLCQVILNLTLFSLTLLQNITFFSLVLSLNLYVTDTVLNFIRSHPLMDAAVSHERGVPVFFKRDLILTHLVVDKININVDGEERNYVVYYTGSSE